MTTNPSNTNTNLADLPPELLDHIITCLPTASSLSNLGRTSKQLKSFVGKEEPWQAFATTRFPTFHPTASPSWRDTTRSLTTLSRAHDRRAILARTVEPYGDILALPAYQRLDRWLRPKGQTIGFTPQLDVAEYIGSRWNEREEILVFSAGAEIVLRRKEMGGCQEEKTTWTTYRPLTAYEGRDDVTAIHILRRDGGDERQRLISGTANGDLQSLTLPVGPEEEVHKTYFTTQGRSVRSSCMLRSDGDGKEGKLLAVTLGDSHVALYDPQAQLNKNAPLSELDLRPTAVDATDGNSTRSVKGHKIWSTSFLSAKQLAVGLGPHTEPIRIFSITPSGLDKEPLRSISLLPSYDPQEDRSDEIAPGGVAPKPTRSVYPIVPLPPASASSSIGSCESGNVFLSGGYDGIIRLHDLRSPSDVETSYVDPTDDSAIYSLLPRGRETVFAGTARHSLLKVFDLRLGARCYDYSDVASLQSSNAGVCTNGTGEVSAKRAHTSRKGKDYNIFLTSSSASQTQSRAQRGWRSHGSGVRESSIYTLATPSPFSPTIYAGIENGVLDLTFTGVLDRHPDPVVPSPGLRWNQRGGDDAVVAQAQQWLKKNRVLDLSMYDQDTGLQLVKQKGVRLSTDATERVELDERWDL
ncbi:hypothetical protein K431DRAFT_285859 [Polychaeton citri CBS 116435]|uniref:F-box domain-containing protein n=1 Tax=Polychaeton citri CBS 116435 TaxID=1314669 RepID=A0A9P4UP26_9PEZI|nr:hypothetical protein K431DRAFT_285859 [Polychaeton citri CBS 116435]